MNRSGDSILYRSGMNAKIKRNFLIHGSIHEVFTQVFTTCDFIAPNIYHRYAAHSRQALSDGALLRLVFQQDAWAAQEACRGGTGGGPRASPQQQLSRGCGAKGNAAIEIIEHLALKPQRIPSRSWRELIKHDQEGLGS